MAPQQNFNVVIIGGNGKVGLNLITGITTFIKTYKGKKVVVTVLRVRDDHTTTNDELLSLPNVTVSNDFQALQFADMVFIGVPPVQEAINALSAKMTEYLHHTGSLGNKGVPILSYSSGLSLSSMGKFFRGRHKPNSGLVRFTLNTNLDTANGLIYYSTHHDEIGEQAIKFLAPISQLTKVRSRSLPKYTAGAGSVNAYDGVWIDKVLSEADILPSQYPSALQTLAEHAEKWTGTPDANLVERWLTKKVKGYESIGFTKEKAIVVSRETFLSTIKSYIHALGKYLAQKSTATRDELHELITKRIAFVPTPKGCTEGQLVRQRACITAEEMISAIDDMIIKTFKVARLMNISFISHNSSPKIKQHMANSALDALGLKEKK
jgi:pyrroline-5-carboxylate reductase